MTSGGPVNIFVPLGTVASLSVPPLAITDGSPNPAWVELPCKGGFRYGRRRALRLPFDAATAEVARRWLRFDRLWRTVLTPVNVTLLLAAPGTRLLPGDGGLRDVLPVVFYGAVLCVATLSGRVEQKVAVAQHPQVVGRLGVYLPAVSAAVAQEWMNHNPGVRVVTARPRWRRYPSWVYAWSSGVCASAGVGVYWVALRDGTFALPTLLVFVVLLGTAVVLALRSLPAGFIRLDDTPGPR